MADNTSTTVIILEPDRASAAETRRVIDGVKTSLEDMGKGTQLRGLLSYLREAKGDASNLQKELGKISRNEQLTQVAKEMGDLAKKTGDVAGAVGQLDSKLKKLGATKEEISGLAGVFNSAANAPDEAPAKGLGARLTSYGQSLRNLPSQQIPGLGIGTDAIGNLLRVGGAIKTASDNAKAAAAATAAASALATAAEGGQAAASTALAGTSVAATGGILSMVVALGPVALLGAAIGVAVGGAFLLIKQATDAFAASAAENSAKITRAYEASDTVFDSILNGDTSEEARKKIEQETKKRANADREYNNAVQQSNARYQELVDQFDVVSADIAKQRGTDGFAEFNERIKTTTEDARVAEANIAAFNAALENGEYAANDAAEAEKKRADELEKATKASEQASKEVAAAQERIADAARKNADKLADNARQANEKLADIDRSGRDKRADSQRKYNDDLATLDLKARRETLDASVKATQKEQDAINKARIDEADAAIKQQRTLDDIRRDGQKDEQDQLRQRNFLGATLAQEAVKDSVEDAQRAAQREAEDREAQAKVDQAQRYNEAQRAAQERQTNQARARTDRMAGYAQEQRDNKIAQDRSYRDAAIAQSRQEEATQIAYTRELEQLQAHLGQKLALESQAQAAERALKNGTSVEQELRLGGPGTNVSNNRTANITDNRTLSISGVTYANIEKTALRIMGATRYR